MGFYIVILKYIFILLGIGIIALIPHAYKNVINSRKQSEN